MPSARTFDLSVKLKGNEIVLFTGLNKEELESIEEFLRMKKIRVKNETEELAVAVDLAMGDGSDDGGDVEMQGLVGEELDEDSEGTSLFPLQNSLGLTRFHSRRRFPGIIRVRHGWIGGRFRC